MSVAGGRPQPAWSTVATARLLDTINCPVCHRGKVMNVRCPRCGADFSGDVGERLWRASETAAHALQARQEVLESVPVGDAAWVRHEPETHRPQPERAPSPGRASATTVQSVLAVSGAGLLAIAAMVFTFLTPDLRDAATRALVMAGVSLVFLIGARTLAPRQLRFSAESVGALGAAFLALAVISTVAALPPTAPSGMVFAVAALIGGVVMTALGVRVRLHAWVWSGMVALACVPVLYVSPSGSAWAAAGASLASAAAASALIALAGRLQSRFASGLALERGTLTVVQFVAVLAGVGFAATILRLGPPSSAVLSGALLVGAAVAVCSARHPAGAAWSGLAGAAIVAAAAVLPFSSSEPNGFGWYVVSVPAAAGLALVLVGAARPLHRMVGRSALLIGAMTAMSAVLVLPTMLALASLAAAGLVRTDAVSVLDGEGASALTSGLAFAGVAIILFGALTAPLRASISPATDSDSATPARSARAPGLLVLGEWYLVVAALTLMAHPSLGVGMRIGIAVAFAGTVGVLHLRGPLRRLSGAVRAPLVAAAHLFVVLAVSQSWQSIPLALGAGVLLVIAFGLLAGAAPPRLRMLYAGTAFAYVLVLLATALGFIGLDPVVVLCAVTSCAGLVAVAATFVPAVSSRVWLAILVVTSVPFLLGVLQVVMERSGWTALSTSVIFLLALSLLSTTREGLGVLVRTLAASILVPALAVVLVCLGAQFLQISGSPVVLPLIAASCAAILTLLPAVGRALGGRMEKAHAVAAERAVEFSTLLTAAITVGLALGRDAAGLGTAMIVLSLLGVGFLGAAGRAQRRYGWWLAGIAFTGALWCVWGLLGVAGIEAYVLPPAVAAAAIGAARTALGRPDRALFAGGLAAAVGSSLVAQALAGTVIDRVMGGMLGADAAAPIRAGELIVVAWALVLATTLVQRSGRVAVRRLRLLVGPTLLLAILACAAAPVQGVRWRLDLDPTPGADTPVLVTALTLGILAGGAAALAGRGIRLLRGASTPRLARWALAPAILLVAASVWPAMESTWFAIWTMWTLMLALLTVVVVTAFLALRGKTMLPPVPFSFGVAFITAVVAWSSRELRVEWFSLPLGLFLLAAGALALRASTPGRAATLASWPVGWQGSWGLLGPGLVVLLSASVAATYTDPRTWRAILVMVIALIAVLIGALARLAAPFLIGVIVLPVENVLAFLVQIGRGVAAMPWWITLSVVGAVLLIIAVGYERRAESGAGFTARLRDLR